jgi:hypothetical protein
MEMNDFWRIFLDYSAIITELTYYAGCVKGYNFYFNLVVPE